MKLVHSNKFEANKWIITARWFYAPTIFVIGLLSKFDPLGNNLFPVPLMIFLFSSFILVNIGFWVYIKKLEIENGLKSVDRLAMTQIFVEVLFFLIILYISGGPESVAPIFFFIPIVSSIILFDVLGSLTVAFVSGLIVNSLVVLQYKGVLKILYGNLYETEIGYDEYLALLASTVTITSVYLIVATLAGYLSSVIKDREKQLVDSKKKSQFQIERLRLLNDEYNSYARMLVRKDLELTKENQKITELDREKSEFVSTVSHQLRTPLSAIKWTLDLLLKGEAGELSSEQKAFVMKAYEGNERTINLIKDMLGVDNIERGMMGFSFLEINMADLVDNVLADFEWQIEQKKIQIKIEKRQNLPHVTVDAQKMRAVFQNLIENAVKYSNIGGILRIKLDADDENSRITIEDNGIGIPAEQQKDIFKRFFRAKNVLKLDPNGSGLGLFIVKEIIERHGGKIAFESKEGSGTKFIVSLPLRH